MWRNSRAVALRVLLAVWALPVLAGTSVPDWVQQAAAKEQGKYPADAHAVVLLNDEVVNVSGPGQADVVHRRVVRILRPEGRNEGRFHMHLSPGDKLQSLHAWSVDNAGRQYELKEKEFSDVSPFHEELYSDVHYRAAEVPAANPGSVIAFEYSVRRHVWMDEWSWSFQEDIPVDEARLTLQLPAGWEFKESWANHPAEKPVQLGGNRWQWVCRDIPGIPEEKHSPYPGALAGRMEIAFFTADASAHFGSWKAIGDWYYKLTSGRRDANPEIAARARDLTAGATTFDAKVRALANFVQSDIRYVAIEIGIGGYQPHAASDVYRVHYGDCKDKATLLSSMLKEIGITSDYLLVDTEQGVVKPEVPAPYFNHVILAIALPADVSAGQYRSVVKTPGGSSFLIFDPTDEYTPLGDLRAHLQGSYGLLVTASGGELMELPVLPPNTNRIAREGKFTLQADGSISGKVTESRTGTHAMTERYLFARENDGERSKTMDHVLSRSLKNVELQQLHFSNVSAREKDLTVEYELKAAGYAQKSGPLVLVRPRVLGEKQIDVDWSKRKLPVVFSGATEEKDTFEIQLPQGYVVDELPDPRNVDVGFASYTSKTEASGSTIRYTREYVVREPYIPREKVADLKKFEEAIGGDEFATAIVKKAQ